MLYYIDSKANKAYILLNGKFIGVDISCEGHKTLHNEIYDEKDVFISRVCTLNEVKVCLGIDEENEYHFPTNKKGKVVEEPVEEETVEEQPVEEAVEETAEEIVEETVVEEKKENKKENKKKK